MLTLEKFAGLNNVLPPKELGAGELTAAQNIDIDTDQVARRRSGYSLLSATVHRNLFEAAAGYTLATRGPDGDLVRTDTGEILQQSLGLTRVWYTNLPDGRVAFSNGLICGLTDGITTTPWGVPLPSGLGGAYDVPGQLDPGRYRYALSHVRNLDGLESGMVFSQPVDLQQGGLSLLGLPQRDTYSINVYLTGADGETFYYAGTTDTTLFAFTGRNPQLVLRSITNVLQPAPAGRLLAFWRTRALLAVDNVLYASRANNWEHFDLLRDLKQFGAPITLVQPVEAGIFVGTEQELSFLAGSSFDQLVRAVRVPRGVALGSGVTLPAKHLPGKMNGDGQGDAMLCIAGGILVAGLGSGAAVPLTQNRYKADGAEFAATFRIERGVPQYIAIAQ